MRKATHLPGGPVCVGGGRMCVGGAVWGAHVGAFVGVGVGVGMGVGAWHADMLKELMLYDHP